MANVVITEANKKYMIKTGNTFFTLNFLLFVYFSFLQRIKASVNVMGIMANVLVNLTVTALSSVAEPKWYMLSQQEEAAVTDEVSLIAVPEKMPKASPEV